MPLITAWTRARSTRRAWRTESKAPEATPASRPSAALPEVAATATEVNALVRSTASRPIWMTPERSAQMPPTAAHA